MQVARRIKEPPAIILTHGFGGTAQKKAGKPWEFGRQRQVGRRAAEAAGMDAIARLADQGATTLVEVAPGGILPCRITRQSLEMPSSFEECAQVSYLNIISDQQAMHDRVAEKISERRLLIEAITGR